MVHTITMKSPLLTELSRQAWIVHPNIQTNVFNKKKKKKKKKETVNESLNAGFTLHASGRNTLRWPESGQLKYDEAMTKSRDWRGIRFQNPRGEARLERDMTSNFTSSSLLAFFIFYCVSNRVIFFKIKYLIFFYVSY
jgi:hypothetical protein